MASVSEPTASARPETPIEASVSTCAPSDTFLPSATPGIIAIPNDTWLPTIMPSTNRFESTSMDDPAASSPINATTPYKPMRSIKNSRPTVAASMPRQ